MLHELTVIEYMTMPMATLMAHPDFRPDVLVAVAKIGKLTGQDALELIKEAANER